MAGSDTGQQAGGRAARAAVTRAIESEAAASFAENHIRVLL